MMKIDWTRPIRFFNGCTYSSAILIGDDPTKVSYKHVVRITGFDQLVFVCDAGDISGSLGAIKQAPVTHKRWIVLYQSASGVYSSTFKNPPPSGLLKRQIHPVIAVKEVTIEEGEGI